MRFAIHLGALLCLAAPAQSQTYDRCVLSCTNIYNLCASNAEQQLGVCQTNCGGCDGGCPGGSATGNHPDPCGCSAAYDAAILACNLQYDDCVNNCGQQELPPLAFSPTLRRPGSGPAWALLLRNLSRPEKLNLTL